MDYFTVALTANLTAFVTTFGLLVLLIFQSFSQAWKRYLVIGVIGQFAWIMTLLTSYYTDVNSILMLDIELLRLVMWLSCLILLLLRHTKLINWPNKLKVLTLATIAVSLSSLFFIHISESSANSIRLSLLLLATLSLVFTEQVVRNLNSHRMIKLFGLCLTFLFAYDILLYGQGLLTNDVSSITLQGRAALAFTVAIALAIGTIIFNEQNDTYYLFSVSRPAAFFSTAILFSALLIVVITVGRLYISDKGYLGTYLFSLALLVSVLLLVALLVSQTFRQHFEVFISKHFFALKYDYRTEWLKAIRNLSELKSDQPDYYVNISNILKSAVRAQSASLWISNGSELKEITSTLPLSDMPGSIQVNEPFIRTMLKESWIYVPHSKESSLANNNRLLPEWVYGNSQIWLIAPLMIQMKLVGFVVLSKPKVTSDVTFEDRDLMTNISTQVASHILLHQQEKVISDAKQLETYNRLSAFIMHDINNVIAQLALIGKNAERHKDNPAFIDDMIKTVHNATTRMQSLVQKFNPASKEKRTSVYVNDLMQELKTAVADFEPAPEFIVQHNFTIDADKQRLMLALKNLVRNAQEATNQDGSIVVQADHNTLGDQIIIQDTGHGMSQRFINEELFRPFVTTKDDSGVGIGAYLTKSYIEHLGAMVNVKSTEGEGTRFEITFS